MKKITTWFVTGSLIASMIITGLNTTHFVFATENENKVVASINETDYTSFDEAYDALNEGEVIVLNDDVTLTVSDISKPVEVIGNGHTITVPTQPKSEDGRLTLNAAFTLRNANIYFCNPTSWSLVMSGNGVLNIYENSTCAFEKTGIYTSPNATINVDHSKMTLEDMEYTCMMAEAYAYLNLTNEAEFYIQNAININGMTGFTINVDNSYLSIKDCQRQGLVKCNLFLNNNAKADLMNNYTGYNMYGGNQLIVNDGCTLTVNKSSSRAIMSQGKGEITVKAGGTMIVTENGQAWNASDDETKYYAQKGAITIGCYGWSNGEIYLYTGHTVTFEDGANVDISNNYVRGIFNNGTTLYIGSNTSIQNNGMLAENETAQDIRVGQGGGIYNRTGTTTLSPNAKVYNNHARESGDDIYNESGSIILNHVADFEAILDDDNKIITDWFFDGLDGENETPRWNAFVETADEDLYYVPTTELNITAPIALKAAHPTYFYNVTVNYLDKDTNEVIATAYVTEDIREGKTYDVTAYDKISIDGYDYIVTTGDALSGVIDGNKVINVYYSKPTIPTTPEDNHQENIKNDEAVDTSDTNNPIIFAVLAMNALALAVVYLLRENYAQRRK